jgi:hypothetical protein
MVAMVALVMAVIVTYASTCVPPIVATLVYL